MLFKQYILPKPLLYVYFFASVRAMISFKYLFQLIWSQISLQQTKLKAQHTISRAMLAR